MKSNEELKRLVQDKYGAIAEQSDVRQQDSCCSSSCGCSGGSEFTVMAEDYTHLSGYNPEADLLLGCGLPTEHAHLKPGDTVLDLGSGAGNDCFVARAAVGAGGKVIGIDMTEKMINRARSNAQRLGYDNVEFRLGEIEHLPVESSTVDVVVSNCVMNLVPDKEQAFRETWRVLKPDGHFSISDIVLDGELPEVLREEASLYVGCIAGAMQEKDYLRVISRAGFVDVAVQKKRAIDIPDDVLRRHISDGQLAGFRTHEVGIYSVTVFARKPTA